MQREWDLNDGDALRGASPSSRRESSLPRDRDSDESERRKFDRRLCDVCDERGSTVVRRRDRADDLRARSPPANRHSRLAVARREFVGDPQIADSDQRSPA